MLSFTSAIKMGIKKGAQYSGRSLRSEFWWYFIIAFPLFAFFSLFTKLTPTDYFFIRIISSAITALLGLSILTISVRRLHDINCSGWWMLLIFIPFVQFALLIMFVLPSSKGANKYDEQPLPQ